MALRILPFRQYSDHDVVNMYSIIDSDVLDSTTGSGLGDAGVFVKVADGNFDNDPVTYQTNSYLGNTDYPFLGTTEMYPEVNIKVTGAVEGDRPLGMTLYQTAKNDENGEKLVFNPRKAAEMEIALSGQAAPVCSRGIFLYSGTVLASETPTAGISLYYDDNAELTTGTTNSVVVGKALGVKDDNNHVLVRIDV